MRKSCLLVAFLLFSAITYAQKVAVKKVEVSGEKIIVHYDLEDSNPNNEYQISLYSSQNNFSTALNKVTGDVGSNVKAGAEKKIVWSIREELGPYKGKISLEVRGKVAVAFVKLSGFETTKAYKRGKSYPIHWSAVGSTPIHIELYKGSHRVSGELNHPNNGSYTLPIPASAKPGKDYRLKFTDSKNNEDVIYSNTFKVTPKIPLLLKVAPVVVVGGVIAALAGGDKKKPDDTTTGGEIDLPTLPGGN